MVGIKKVLLLCAICYILCAALTGCGPTYPKKNVKEAVAGICTQEYGVNVKVETYDKTMFIYLPLKGLLDYSFNLTRPASEKINNVIFTAARVTLSTDAKFDFYCVIAHDIKMPELQIVIIKNVEDVRRLFASDISRGEYMKRVLIDLRWSPQAKKEQVVKDIFNKMNLDQKWQDQIISDFFRSEPAAISDIGYWNDRFYIKDITLAEFLAEQIANRIKIEFRESKDLKDIFLLKSAKGLYAARKDRRLFRFEIMAERGAIGAGTTIENSDKIFEKALSMAGHVLHGYHFKDYDAVEVFDQREGRSIEVTPEELENFRMKKVKLNEIGK